MKLRRILIILGLLGVIVVIAANFGNPHDLIQAFKRVRWYVVPLVIMAQLIDYYCAAKYYQSFFAISHHKVDLKRLFEAALAINFANQTIPSGGVVGATYLAQAVKSSGVPSGKATLAQLGRYIFTFLSYFIVLAFGFLMLFFSDDLDKASVRFIVLLMIIILAAGLVLLAIFSERKRLEAFIEPFIRLINQLGRHLLRRKSPLIKRPRLADFLAEFYRSYHEIMSHKGRWPVLLLWSLGSNLAEILTIYAVLFSFGHWINPGIIITGYTLAIIASFASFFINGYGVYEAGMIGTFVALGVPFALAFAVVIVYRILNLVLFLPPGFIFYRRHLKEAA